MVEDKPHGAGVRRPFRLHRLAIAAAGLAFAPLTPAAAESVRAETTENTANGTQPSAAGGRVVYADVVAINQPLVYNRFGSTNPWGMIYALRDHVEGCTRAPGRPGGVEDASKCRPGSAMLKPDIRPRPLVLRINEGDRLVVRFQNLLMPMPSRTRPLTPDAVGGVTIPPALVTPQKLVEAVEPGEPPEQETVDPRTIPDPPNDPTTRLASIAIVGLRTANGADGTATGLIGIAPGATTEYTWFGDKRGSYFFSSLSAVQGGEGDGGSLTHGLFGMVVVEPAGAQVYRSQISAEDMACLRNEAGKGDGCENSAAAGPVNYHAARNGKPVAAMLLSQSDGSFRIIHSDLTAIVAPAVPAGAAPCAHKASATDNDRGRMDSWRRPAHCPYREFSIIFHDELKTVHAPAYAILNGPTLDPGNPRDTWDKAQARHKQIVGARDGFAINYGASGMGTALISNRAGVGPARNCVDCAYEEFFLQSWANGDPALLPQYADDPSNVYHSYLGDPVEFHNVHAGPKETHVFHLHAHQWLSQEGNSAANYLDSQTIGPFQSFTYQIEYGGSGNRNLGPGDSIFHCHLYPHFAQGMWGLWRTHDVFEDGTRLLPDGGGLNAVPGTTLTEWQGPGTDPLTGQTPKMVHANGMVTGGTPIPALVPLPGMALAPQPTYAANGMPGYPFYIPGKPGFRAPQPPLDMAQDGGLPRHITGAGVRTAFGEKLGNPATATRLLNKGLENGDLTFEIEQVALTILPQTGTALERAAMAFHAQASTANGFRLNGRPAAAGSPYGNPCPAKAPHVQYNASAIETNLLVNRYGWHDPQARINVLDGDLPKFQWAAQRSTRTPQAADPFFFRVHSGDCVTFRHTNRTSSKTGRDPFQVAAPTDIIGQHIHLVKFDVTSSDGSANGFNYEDGTLASGIIAELIHASSVPGGSVTGEDGNPAVLTLPVDPEARYQATYQRWWADPRLDAAGKDQTLGTVFTHDHFAPSNIQQHGFYNALIVEPKKSRWRHPDGTPMPKLGPDGSGGAVGTQAIIATPSSSGAAAYLRGNRREFVLAVADFALLYDGSGPNSAYAIDDYPTADGDRVTFAANGRPIAPPQRPEAISVDHHDPFLFNYKLEPMPVRMGDYSQRWHQYTGQKGDAAYAFSSFVHRQTDASLAPVLSAALPKCPGTGRRTDLDAIDQRCNHTDGDPSTEIFEAYVGDKAIVRLIQGAQEVQHVFEVNGLSWRRQPGDPASPRVASQEIGISEHFEMDLDMPLSSRTFHAVEPVDFRYGAGTVDATWNGAWGLIRTYPDRKRALDPGRGDFWQNRTLAAHDAAAGPAARPAVRPRVACRLADIDGKRATDCDRNGAYAAEDGGSVRTPLGTYSVLRGEMLPDFTKASGMKQFHIRKFCIAVKQGEIVYNRRERISDPQGLRYEAVTDDTMTGVESGHVFTPADVANEVALQQIVQTMRCETPHPATRTSPLVLRMNAGDFAIVDLRNDLPSATVSYSQTGNSVLPPIVPSSSQTSPSGKDISDRTAADRLDPSSRVSIVPQLVTHNLRNSAGMAVGANETGDETSGEVLHTGYASADPAGRHARQQIWFAGTFATLRKKSAPSGFRAFTPFATDRGMVAALASLADPVKHPGMGLVGALVIEPAGATWQIDPGDPTLARVTLADGRSHREAVLVYQDGLNLKTETARHREPGGPLTPEERAGTATIPDCHICDDTYDSGDIAVNYRTEPFWARLNQSWRSDKVNPETGQPMLVDLNAVSIPRDIWFNPVGGAGSGAKIETPVIPVIDGETLVIHAVHPGGRARQRALVTNGHRYLDHSLPKFGSPASALLAPRKATSAVIDRVEHGCWLWRDGPAQFVGGGAWGMIVAQTQGVNGSVDQVCPAHD
ncbi:hypothetical protein NT2_09_00340 [Caenibius tardaugens NBRC 16725]|uniref:Multicopper oxidase n=1 Tax=Caenibius tardaugens NBRC 16725 TaxID=1219035 RepID=U2YAJ4_9SPHN|nr:hypothetical protein [Caenibius tardaugens]AZI35476.1 hypothetical protein EGO55_05460 [Caenibius tardaugens NBRC 16725]GAD50426.1 hypothetical protein NT2_09_00340 [Caenibius tardaugens NBRC 16725]